MPRIDLTLNDNMSDRLVKEVDRTGLSKAAVMTLALDFYLRAIKLSTDDLDEE